MEMEEVKLRVIDGNKDEKQLKIMKIDRQGKELSTLQ